MQLILDFWVLSGRQKKWLGFVCGFFFSSCVAALSSVCKNQQLSPNGGHCLPNCPDLGVSVLARISRYEDLTF